MHTLIIDTNVLISALIKNSLIRDLIVNSQFNPCKYHKCENVDWSKKTLGEAGINQQCKLRVNAYCNEHPYLDDFCKPWRTENKDLPKHKKFRNQFLSTIDKNCSASDFKIEEHPDYVNYIKKDKIPCWNCNLD